MKPDFTSDGAEHAADHNDWRNIVLPLTWTSWDAQTGVNPWGSKPTQKRINPMTNDNQPIIIEPLHIKDWLEHVH